ncbi:MAG: hypothetical protein R6V31_04615, partial [Halohasta sp.]
MEDLQHVSVNDVPASAVEGIGVLEAGIVNRGDVISGNGFVEGQFRGGIVTGVPHRHVVGVVVEKAVHIALG